jgi:protein O-mannosyl-transferase
MPARSETRIIIFCLLLVTATLAFYNPVIHNQFIDFDDSNYIVNNTWIQHGVNWETVRWSLTTFKEGNWHPLTWLSHSLDYRFFKLDPAGHHYTNVLLHAINAVLLFLLLWRQTGRTWPSFLVSAIFALHPVNVESVAWAAERKNVLSTLFFLLALHAYGRYARTGRRVPYLTVIVCFGLGLMAKPQIVTLPFVLLLLDYWPLQRMKRAQTGGGVLSNSAPRTFTQLVVEKWPLFALAAADSIVTVMAQHAGNAVRTVAEVPVSARFTNVVVSYVEYIGKMLWPTNLAPMYPRTHDFPVWQIAAAATLLLVVSAAVLLRHDRRYLAFGWFWFVGTLVPMVGIITVGEQSMADRYAYIPFIGLFVALVWAADDWRRGATDNGLMLKNNARTLWCSCAAMIVLAALGCTTHRQLAYWHDDETLWRYTSRVTEKNYTAHNNLALALAKQGRSDEAIVEFRAAKALHNYPSGQVLALALYELRAGHPKEAIEECDSVLRNPDSSGDRNLQFAAWSELGEAHLQLSEYDLAVMSYKNALSLSPENVGALVASGMLELRVGNPEMAVTSLEKAVRIDPTNVNYLLLAEALRQARRPQSAAMASAEAKKISPDLYQAQIVAGQFLAVAEVKAQH